MSSPLADQWWVINGDDLLDHLRRAKAGEDPDLLYLELAANSTSDDEGLPSLDEEMAIHDPREMLWWIKGLLGEHTAGPMSDEAFIDALSERMDISGWL